MVDELGILWLPIGLAIAAILVALHTCYKSTTPLLHHTHINNPSSVATSTIPIGAPGLMRTPAIVSSILNDAAFRYRIKQFQPPWWLASGHLQTMFSAKGWHIASPVKYQRQLLPVIAAPPGRYDGTIALDWTIPPDNEPYDDDTPIAVVLHGLTGGSHEPYVLRMIHELLRYKLTDQSHTSTKRMRAVVINARGCGGSTLMSGQAYCGAMTADARQAIIHIRSLHPRAPLVGIGFSLGANILTKYVCEEGDTCALIAAAVLANPWDLLQSCRVLNGGWFSRQIYAKTLAANLVRLFQKHKAAFANESNINFDELSQCVTVRDFDECVTRRTFGYASVDDYYRDGSSAQYVPGCRRPLLCLNALDDPISPEDAIPVDEIRNNKWCVLVTTKSGGHSMDWFSGQGFQPASWSPPVVGAFFQAALRATGDLTNNGNHNDTANANSKANSNCNGHDNNNGTVRRSLLPSLQVCDSPTSPVREVPVGTRLPQLQLPDHYQSHHTNADIKWSPVDIKRATLNHTTAGHVGASSNASLTAATDNDRRIHELSVRLANLSLANTKAPSAGVTMPSSLSSLPLSPSLVHIHYYDATPMRDPSTCIPMNGMSLTSSDALVQRAASALQHAVAADDEWQRRQDELSRRLDALITAAGGTPLPLPLPATTST